MEPGLQVYESEARTTEKPDLGPVCYDCGKPVKVHKDKGGCACLPRPIRESQITQATTTADRQLFALERIAACLEAYCKHGKIEVAEVKPLVGAASVPVTGTPIDAIRARAKTG